MTFSWIAFFVLTQRKSIGSASLLLGPLTRSIVLFEECDQILDLFLVGQSSVCHLGARYLRARIAYVFGKYSLIPDNPRIFICITILVTFNHAGLAANKAVEDWTNRVLCILANLVASAALRKNLSAAPCARTSEANTATISVTINMTLFWFPSCIAFRPIAEAISFTSEQNCIPS